jgi:ABC-type transporter Mla MlaB component
MHAVRMTFEPPVTLPVIGDLDVAAIPGLRRAIASLNGNPGAVLLDLSRATFVDSSAPRPLLELRLLGRDPAQVRVDGRTLKLSRRHTEIVALLSARRGGMTSEELAADLYGDDGNPSTVRVLVCRLRRLLGDSIATERYRLRMDVESDFRRVQRLLERGLVGEAAERYAGPLLPYSEAPGVVREREALDAWMRHAVMTADDPGALWAWLRSPSGADDLLAWKRLLAQLSFQDPRRSLAAARVRSLREAYGAPADVR